MAFKILNLLFIICTVESLITKDFKKYKINKEIESDELANMPGMDRIQCSYFCLKSDQCQAFYVTNEGSCRQVPLDQCFKKVQTITGDTITLYSTSEIERGNLL